MIAVVKKKKKKGEEGEEEEEDDDDNEGKPNVILARICATTNSLFYSLPPPVCWLYPSS